ncbi:hypothetical protein EDB86DRAFT_2832784 [Lactarius hatsudake]|nr:hypothetical protein EDB86DRAFT_2832784 [Lactarius hatsudake]
MTSEAQACTARSLTTAAFNASALSSTSPSPLLSAGASIHPTGSPQDTGPTPSLSVHSLLLDSGPLSTGSSVFDVCSDIQRQQSIHLIRQASARASSAWAEGPESSPVTWAGSKRRLSSGDDSQKTERSNRHCYDHPDRSAKATAMARESMRLNNVYSPMDSSSRAGKGLGRRAPGRSLTKRRSDELEGQETGIVGYIITRLRQATAESRLEAQGAGKPRTESMAWHVIVTSMLQALQKLPEGTANASGSHSDMVPSPSQLQTSGVDSFLSNLSRAHTRIEDVVLAGICSGQIVRA